MTNYYSLNSLRKMGIKIIGDNIKISKFARIYNPTKLTLYDNVRIDDFTILSGKGNITLKNYIHIGPYCFLSSYSNIIMNDYTGLSSGVKLFGSSDDYSGKFMTNPTIPSDYLGTKYGDIILNNHSIIGSNSIVLPDINLGEGTAIGTSSLVNKDTLDWHIYGGTPIKIIKERSKDCKKFEKYLKCKYN